MKTFYLAAALLMATTAAHAGNSVSFQIEGQRIKIEASKNCDSLSCVTISAPGLSGSNFNLGGLKGFKGFNNSDDDDVADNSTTAPARPAPPAPAVQASAPQAVTPQAVVAQKVQPQAAPATVTVAAPVASAPAAVAATAAPVAAAPIAVAPAVAAPVADLTSPLGVWATEENKGNVRIEQCGQNLCGYAVNSGEKILISMKPSAGKWTGQIHDPDSGRNYDSTIAMKGTNALKVQGCAFGGMFCGGQTWKRVS